MRFFSLIYQGDVHPSNGDKVIPAEEFSTLMTAQELLEKAKEDAAHFREDLEKEANSLRDLAKEEGFQSGLENFNDKLLWFDREIKALRLELQNQILPLALKAARKIVANELKTHPETIVEIVIQALTPVLQSKQITILVNKVDRETLEAAKPRFRDILDQVDSFTILDRPDISPGGCVIETESGIINATIENQWRALESAFARYMKLS
ncbi:MAG: HrpE/YscL family type III secretion apparatus protein [Simkania sp.]|nr:HrpE/YscL family type III secretion apparatus protein [Simkania sp.]